MWESEWISKESEGWEAHAAWLSTLHSLSLCAVHVRQFEGASPLSNPMEVKD